MKKGCSAFFFLSMLLMIISSCNSNKQNDSSGQVQDSLSLPEHIRVISAIGRVEPESGLTEISSETGGIVSAVYKYEGDSVTKGERLISLEQGTGPIDVQLIESRIQSQKKRLEADKADIVQFEVQLVEKENDLAVSEKLAATGAETRQQVERIKKERDVLRANLNKSSKNSEVSLAIIAELNKELQIKRKELSEKSVLAQDDGILLSMDARPGSAVQPYRPFAVMAPAGKIIVHGEADEMFASRIQTGQVVKIHYPGNPHDIANGKIIFVSPVLSNKSLFYEQPGETSDRRVRRFKVAVTDSSDLLINSKVECTIQID